MAMSSTHVAVKAKGATRTAISAPPPHPLPTATNRVSTKITSQHERHPAAKGSAGSSLTRAAVGPLLLRYKQNRGRLSTASPLRSLPRDGIRQGTVQSNTTTAPAAKLSMKPTTAMERPKTSCPPSKQMSEISMNLGVDTSKVLLALQNSLKVTSKEGLHFNVDF